MLDWIYAGAPGPVYCGHTSGGSRCVADIRQCARDRFIICCVIGDEQAGRTLSLFRDEQGGDPIFTFDLEHDVAQGDVVNLPITLSDI
jgi:hypothetical protein